MANRRLLISFAHPDDESFGLGGLISKYVADGVDVYLLCATNGDVGTIDPELLEGYNSIAERRLAELDCAAEKLKFKRVYKLGYKDSGMMSDETIHDPECLWYRWQNDPDSVTRDVACVIREVRPQVVITFNKYGGYGHPDHIAIQRATMAAWDCVNDPNYILDGLEPYQPQKLYYTALPAMMLKLAVWLIRLRRKDPRRVGRNQDIDMQKIVDHIEPVHVRVDIRDYMDAWDEANACHESQGGGRISRIPRLVQRFFRSKQSLTRVYPAPTHNRVDETDLFAHIVLD